MQIIELVDEDGFKRRYAVNDDEDLENVEEVGVDVGVPDLSSIDWDGLHREIHNRLYDLGIFTPDDILARGDGITTTLKIVLGKAIIRCYRN